MARLYARWFHSADAAYLILMLHQAIDAGIKEDEAWKLLRQILQAVRLSIHLAIPSLTFPLDRFLHFTRNRPS